MFQIERQQEILQYINERKTADTSELAEHFNVSKVTIRRDVESLAKNGLVIKTHGGAMAIDSALMREIPYSGKAAINSHLKREIGAAAAGLIKDGDIVILDSGSTTLEVAKNIFQNDITVLTNDLKIALELSNKRNIQVLMCGGSLNSSVFSLIGNTAREYFSRFHANKTFLGCDAVDVAFGISNRTYEEAPVKLSMIKAADEVIMVTDNSKLNKRMFVRVCDLSDIDTLVINQVDPKNRKAFLDSGVKIIETNERQE